MLETGVAFKENPYFNAGFGLAVIGTFGALVGRGAKHSLSYLSRYYTTSVEISRSDKSYDWIVQWLGKKQRINTTHIAVETNFAQTDSGKVITRYQFAPSVGRHLLRYKSQYILVERTRTNMAGSPGLSAPHETLQFKTYGRKQKLFEAMLEEAKYEAISDLKGRTITYIPDSIGWRQFGYPKKQRALGSVILDYGITEKILNDIQDFLSSSNWYQERGIPYRRGYLLHGPPGCGKTSFITALAGRLYYNICILNLGERGLFDQRLNMLLNTAPLQSIIVLEDIDAAVGSTTNSNSTIPSVTFSGLLNSLDGIVSSEERIIFMTTNHINKLDQALIRPGRVDFIQLVSHVSKYQLEEMFHRFYPQASASECVEFRENAFKIGFNLSPAQVQAFLMKYKNDHRRALNNINDLFLKKNDM